MDDMSEKISRVRRSTTSMDILDILNYCEELERQVDRLGEPKPKTDRKAYMREYMRKRREKS